MAIIGIGYRLFHFIGHIILAYLHITLGFASPQINDWGHHFILNSLHSITQISYHSKGLNRIFRFSLWSWWFSNPKRQQKDFTHAIFGQNICQSLHEQLINRPETRVLSGFLGSKFNLQFLFNFPSSLLGLTCSEQGGR